MNIFCSYTRNTKLNELLPSKWFIVTYHINSKNVSLRSDNNKNNNNKEKKNETLNSVSITPEFCIVLLKKC